MEQDTKLAVRTCALGRIKHGLGDAFSIEHVWPTPMLQFSCIQDLLTHSEGCSALAWADGLLPATPPVWWERCFGEGLRHAAGSDSVGVGGAADLGGEASGCVLLADR